MDKESLKKEIESKKQQLRELEELEAKSLRDEAIKHLHEFTIEEKVAHFDEMYNFAKSLLELTEENGYENEDDAHYAWEAVMSLLKKDEKKFREFYKSIS